MTLTEMLLIILSLAGVVVIFAFLLCLLPGMREELLPGEDPSKKDEEE